jgi:GNAT superfamily N-acetyltransferase
VLFPLLILKPPKTPLGRGDIFWLPGCAEGAVDARPANRAELERFFAFRTGSGRRCRFSQWWADFAILSRESLGMGEGRDGRGSKKIGNRRRVERPAQECCVVVGIQPLTERDRRWAAQIEPESVARLGELVDVSRLPGFIAFLEGQRTGLALYALRSNECELVTIRSLSEGRGVGRALLDAVRDAAIEAGCTRLWLITTNDNLRALELYQRWGMEIVAFHRHAVTDARRHLKPSIPARGAHRIPIAHELELELRLEPERSPESSI